MTTAAPTTATTGRHALTGTPNPYREDLDGLRGIAIALVVLFHIFVGRVSGGVDIFLLLSGYFFLGSQLRYASRGNASLNPWWPIWRTLRRLVPTMTVVIGLVFLAGKTILPQWDAPHLTQQVSTSMLYFLNWELYQQGADYNVASDGVSPLQHLWSMAVQGQFYLGAIAFSLGLAYLFRGRRHLVQRVAGPILVALTLVSFAYATWEQFHNQPLNYYSTFSRSWELTLGAALAVYGGRVVFAPLMREIMTALGLLMVVTTGMLFDGATLFPGPAALFPIGGAVLIILGGTGGSSVGAVLASRPLLWLGRVAYPFYVWHWPLLIAATIWSGQPRPSLIVGVVVFLVSLALAHLTHRYVEEPLRQHWKRPTRDQTPVSNALAGLRSSPVARARAVAGALVAVAALVLASAFPVMLYKRDQAIYEYLDPAIYPGAAALAGAPVPAAEPKQDPFVVPQIFPLAGRDGCLTFTYHDTDEFVTTSWGRPLGDPCVYGDATADTTVYLVGGSHAEQWSTALDIIGQRQGFKLVPLLRQGCPTYLSEPDFAGATADCLEWNRNMVDRLVQADPDLVISTTTRPQGETGRGPDVVPDTYPEFWDILAAHDIPFAGLRDNPWGFNAEDGVMDRTQCFADLGDEALCGAPRELIYAPVNPADELLDARENMWSIDTADWFCTPDFCPAVVGNIYVYRDADHVSEAYLRTLVEPLEKALIPVLAQLR
ncbi:acyltransferase family protein [Corynebacterium guangdongense]|uniref:Peptidoglycan/LPS O-acetylase OafA/YrhL n=1 Tax=Corynebacterium guangdongense TaxID=1783348 RepID=A0ABU1ZXI4_9CORY|nr:acyltransferase family protein [Corynebacterium guangdongense]MDR7329636.1 peptidoglycan/LPS O-acetylase OafA/YrhL [Corynebacterium guangdongense]WJZ18201.1 O-acetyltransferase OatA [Corynebacterium guangdongense]